MPDAKSNIRDLLERPARSTPSSGSSGAALESESEYSAFAQGRVSRHVQQTVIFRWADGSMRAFAYSFFYGAEAGEAESGFTLDFMQHKVTVRGRNLATLFRLLCEQRVAEVRQADHTDAFAVEPSSPLVEGLEVNAADSKR